MVTAHLNATPTEQFPTSWLLARGFYKLGARQRAKTLAAGVPASRATLLLNRVSTNYKLRRSHLGCEGLFLLNCQSAMHYPFTTSIQQPFSTLSFFISHGLLPYSSRKIK